MNEKRLHILVSPCFLVCLSLLLLNDCVLKRQFHNELTGKLSDFAGLFIFALFWTALFPRLKSAIYILIEISFVFWKSTYSQPLIESWNSLPLFSIDRTVDYSDLLALLCLPVSYAYSRIVSGVTSQRAAIYLIAIISIFAFTATSFSKKTAYDNEYQFQISKKELLERMSHLPAHEMNSPFDGSDIFEISFDSCIGEATISVFEKDNRSLITLKEINYRCPSGDDKQKMLEFFEKEFINKLREETVTKSSHVQYIWSKQPDNPSQPTPTQSAPQKSSPRH